MSKKRKQDKSHDAQYADDMISMDVVSASEMTGMVPTPPLDDSEMEGYLNLFPMTQPVAEAAKKADTPEEQAKHSGKP